MYSSSGTPEPSSESTSYTSMEMADVEAIGSHCQMPFCRQLDFLPFRCESCKGSYCLDHRTETAHSCTNAGAWARARAAQNRSNFTPTVKPTVLTHESQCAEPACKTLINTPLVAGVQCPSCNRSYCLKHRLGESHDCAKLTPVGARASKAQGYAALEKLREWGQATQRKVAMTTGTTAAARARANTDLKRSAKGDAKVPPEKRIYVHVEASSDSVSAKQPSGKFWYSADWSVGRVLDMAAKSLQVQNLNNMSQSEEDKLRVFHVEAGRLLEFSAKLGPSVQTGNTLVLLRGVGPAVPDLITLDP